MIHTRHVLGFDNCSHSISITHLCIICILITNLRFLLRCEENNMYFRSPKNKKTNYIYICITKTCFKMTGLNHLECKAVIWGDVYPPWWSWWHKVVMPNQGCDLKPSFTNQIAKMCKNIVLWSTRPTYFSIIMWIIGGHKFLFSILITVGFNADLVTH